MADSPGSMSEVGTDAGSASTPTGSTGRSRVPSSEMDGVAGRPEVGPPGIVMQHYLRTGSSDGKTFDVGAPDDGSAGAQATASGSPEKELGSAVLSDGGAGEVSSAQKEALERVMKRRQPAYFVAWSMGFVD